MDGSVADRTLGGTVACGAGGGPVQRPAGGFRALVRDRWTHVEFARRDLDLGHVLEVRWPVLEEAFVLHVRFAQRLDPFRAVVIRLGVQRKPPEYGHKKSAVPIRHQER